MPGSLFAYHLSFNHLRMLQTYSIVRFAITEATMADAFSCRPPGFPDPPAKDE